MTRRRFAPSRFLAAVAAIFALALVWAPSVAAVSITFDEKVLRYRADPEEAAYVGLSVGNEPSSDPGGASDWYLYLASSPPVQAAVGCGPVVGDEGRALRTVRCPLGSLVAAQVRYRLSFGGGLQSRARGTDDRVSADLRSGVIYAGAGNDVVRGGDRVYGGPGRDDVEGVHVDGGPGADHVWGDVAIYGNRTAVLRGGPGNDVLDSPGLDFPAPGHGHLYGGRGDDVLNARAIPPSREMVVGGPGNDVIHLPAEPYAIRRDVVRVRGGGVDRVDCGKRGSSADTLFVDRTDRLSPSCKDATVLYTERPRYPYP
jgi:RTX calcium-binding nonapeptide repeat (4 copies)